LMDRREFLTTVVAGMSGATFDAALDEARRVEPPPAPRKVQGSDVVWAPQPGSQEAFLSCPIFEVLYHGTRGGGKSDCILMAFAQHVGKGHGAAWRGVIFRQTYPMLADLVAKSEKWFRLIFPGAQFNRQRMAWEFPGGEVLMFRHMARPEDYWAYHGHEIPLIGWEELTTWPSDECYRSMFSCCRSSNPNVPRMIRATTNPYGVGHNWVKDRFRLGGQWWRTVVTADAVDVEGRPEPPRAAIHSHVDENKILLDADPKYKINITASARNEAMRKAWLDGSWDVVAGGMFSDVWSPRNVVPPFEVPHSWRVDRAFDWGSSKPFSVGWYAQSDGSDLALPDGRVVSTVRGDLFRIREWYGWTGHPNDGVRALAIDVARGIVEREVIWGWRTKSGCRVKPGVADSSIFTVENGISIANDMQKPVRIGNELYPGVKWNRSDKSPGSRKVGWELMRRMIRGARPDQEGRPRETPGLFVVGEHNPQFLRTVLSLPRDEKDLDDVDTDAEDHVADEVRYRIRATGLVVRSGTTRGMT